LSFEGKRGSVNKRKHSQIEIIYRCGCETNFIIRASPLAQSFVMVTHPHHGASDQCLICGFIYLVSVSESTALNPLATSVAKLNVTNYARMTRGREQHSTGLILMQMHGRSFELCQISFYLKMA
jgi:hypothetical protein